MPQTDLFKYIIEKANEIKNEYGADTLYASHIVAAVSDFCGKKYTGFAISEYSHPRYEEERLRYLFSKESRLSSYFKMRLKHNARDKVTEQAFDIESCDKFEAQRKSPVLSADILFLCALRDLHSSYKSAVRTINSDEAVTTALKDVDENIYDYVIEKVEKAYTELKQKANEARAIRDWKPAPTFAPPEKVLALLFERIKKEERENILTLRLAKFFGNADLKLTIYNADDTYYVHDCGCALKLLSRRIADRSKRERVLKKICHSSWIYKGRITGYFTNSFTFFEYIRRLIFVSHADLYYTKANCMLAPKEKGYSYIEEKYAQSLDKNELINILKDGVDCSYDENEGLCIRVNAKCSISSPRMFMLVETLDEGFIRISDKKKGKYEGEILEKFYWDNDDIAPYGKFIQKLASRFGAEFDGKDVYLTSKAENFNTTLFRFLNLAVLLSDLGQNITL